MHEDTEGRGPWSSGVLRWSLVQQAVRVCELSGHSVSLDMSGCSVCTFDFCGVRISMGIKSMAQS